MTYPIHPKQVARIKKHERSIYQRQIAPDLGLLSGFAGAERVFSGLYQPAWKLALAALRIQWLEWRERAAGHRQLASLADLERRALADLGISRAQAGYIAIRPNAAIAQQAPGAAAE